MMALSSKSSSGSELVVYVTRLAGEKGLSPCYSIIRLLGVTWPGRSLQGGSISTSRQLPMKGPELGKRGRTEGSLNIPQQERK